MQPTVNLVGAGHVGRVIGRLLAQHGYAIGGVLTRSAASAQAAVDFIGAGTPLVQYGQLAPADIHLVAVRDDQIIAACAALAQAVPLAGSVVFHCSGALASSELQAARAAGASVASVHPIRSFADPAAVAAQFAGTYCGTEGDAQALAVLAPALASIGAQAVPIDPAAKTVYHAAAVFASNYLVTVLDAALRAYVAAGVPEDVARRLTGPLAGEALANVLRLGAPAALSGPVARGDLATVARQQAAVTAWDGATGQLYADLVAPTATLAGRKHDV